ncbi:MAG: adenylate/guanylate cyclase domain-containing protein [Alphaproteobacteria bacterium]|nr:adenylate/guanylate cyclase domain-containing protein [Alphaproteobacteria bacterium]MCW5743883.1 adenylate/guanylate cyclase domain-containing protein [Alphaproteobacteria bacterium]
MGRDEDGTLARLRMHRGDILEPALAHYSGRLVKLTGDGVLAEFASAVEAVGAAIAIQQATLEANRDRPTDHAIVFRIGVHLGDLIVDGDDLYGDGVNIAARLEGEAPAGGIVVSGDVHNTVAGRLKATFRSLGDLALKNIARPVSAFRVEWDADDWHNPRAAAPVPGVREAPSLAVLPFVNMSGDADQEYFADGITEDIIAALSRFHELTVISRGSSFAFKGKGLDLRRIAEQLGVRYVLGGSMRKAGNRIRVSAELTDAASGVQVWSDRYDRDMADVFDLQDDISRTVAAVVDPAVRGAEIERARRKPPASLSAYDLYLRALPHLWAGTRDDIPKAIDLLRRSISLDPTRAPVHAALALSLVFAAPAGAGMEIAVEAVSMARRAVELDGADAFAQSAYGYALIGVLRDADQAHLHAREAVRLNPSSAFAWGTLGIIDSMTGSFEAAIAELTRALGLSPFDTLLYMWLQGLAASCFALGRFEEGANWARKSVQHNPRHGTSHRLLAANLASAGRLDEAREVTRRRDAVQKTTIGEMRALRLFTSDEVLERYLSAQQSVGVPE